MGINNLKLYIPHPRLYLPRPRLYLPHSYQYLLGPHPGGGGEKLVRWIPGSLVLFYCKEILRVVVAAAVLCSILIVLQWTWIITVVIAIVLAIRILERWINYGHNFCILTDQRIIIAGRRHLLAPEKSTQIEYRIWPYNKAARKTEVKRSLFERILRIGTVRIIIPPLPAVPDSGEEIWLRHVDDPYVIQNVIHHL